MVVKTPRIMRPILVVAALALMALVAIPSASRADSFTQAYPQPNNSTSSGTSTLEGAAYAVGAGGLIYLLFAGA